MGWRLSGSGCSVMSLMGAPVRQVTSVMTDGLMLRGCAVSAPSPRSRVV